MNSRAVRSALAIVFAALAPFASHPSAARAERIILGTVGGLDKAFAPIFFARELGYLKKENLDVELINFAGTGVLFPQVAAGRVEVGFPTGEPLVLSRAPGNPALPVMFFYNVLRTNVWEFAVLDGSPIHKLTDFKGKKIGIISFAAGSLPISKATLAQAGLKEKDYEFVPVGLAGQAILLGRAIAKGTVACEANIPACYKAVWRNDPATRPPNMTDAEAIHYALQINYRRLNAMKTAPGHYGEFDRTTWQTLAEALHDGGQLSTTAIPLDSLYTNAFVKQINDFNYNAVVREAKARK